MGVFGLQLPGHCPLSQTSLVEDFFLECESLRSPTLPQLKGSLSQPCNPEEPSLLFLFKHSSPEITCRMKGGTYVSSAWADFPGYKHFLCALFQPSSSTAPTRKTLSPSWPHRSCLNIPESSAADMIAHIIVRVFIYVCVLPLFLPPLPLSRNRF